MKTPKPYFSWSQLTTLENSEQEYINHYIKGNPKFQTKEMKFGKNQNDDDIPFETEIDGVKIIGYLDKVEKGLIVENKTGKKNWTQERVDNHGQLDFYALLYYDFTGFIPRIELIWKETKEENGEIVFTGRVEKFERKITRKEIDNMRKRIKKALKKIDKLMKIELINDTDIILSKEYLKLEVERKKIELRQKEIKAEQLENIQSRGLNGVSTDYGNFYLITRKSFDYPDEIRTQEDKVKEAKKKYEKTANYKKLISIAFK